MDVATNGIDITLAAVDTVHIELEDGGALDVPTSEFEATERGLSVGLRFLPWHRVRRYGWALASSVEVADADPADRLGPRVRIVFDDDSPAGEEHVVSADRFEAGPWMVSVLLDDVVHAEAARADRRRVFVPWHRVREYERIPAPERTRDLDGVWAPPRPDSRGTGRS
jgi:hypothetical protein